MMYHLTPNKSILCENKSPVLERSLIVQKTRRTVKTSFIWGSINLGVLSILLYDVSYSCPFYIGYYHYAEYSLIIILTFNVLFYLCKILVTYIKKTEPVCITLEQKILLGIKDSDPNFKIINKSSASPYNLSLGTIPPSAFSSTPMNASTQSYGSNFSQTESLNYSMSTPSWTYRKCTSDVGQTKQTPVSSYPSKKTPPSKISFCDTSTDLITDENSLNKYLKEYEATEKANKSANKSQQSTNFLSSFWSHPVTKTAKDMSSFLKKCQYQLSAHSPARTNSPVGKGEDKSGNVSQSSEVWTRINVDSVALTQWNENLRKWLSQTILERLVKEFDRINESLERHGLTDIKIGCVGLDRLRKTSQMVPMQQFIPSLVTLIPFLEVTTNQEYLVKRIRELAKGGCMSEFKWNGGSSYNGKEWDDSLPSDCAIIMHLLACYLDTQLMPLPSMPDTRAFSGHHYIKCTEKMPTLTPSSLFIHQVSEKPPHYRVIIGEKVYEMVKGYNNLFHSILFFIYHVNTVELGMLGRVNLGRAGVNMLWIIEQ